MDRKARLLDQAPHHASWRAAMRRLDRFADWINPFLIATAIGLAILDGGCYLAVALSRPPSLREAGETSAPEPLSYIAVWLLPQSAASPQLTTPKTAYPAPPDYVR
jgi:hypothetical protein